ncbi:universal stress protein [Mycobacterium sp. CVI_P3]|uniref:Universal stress protein n=1 Tax=Mycobacterium pinniadriaticum TaxID=2994102 RepID=A0ABT3SIY3_9MYCO|nr:universal stress protein [Mycobacterium pinniadriaticum]MCX2932660.1 universal stress protein [Mycobacterium pinniadriaticum]MCX2939084.1 universal stress protein [Mycobacterium pinniadriaticum]
MTRGESPQGVIAGVDGSACSTTAVQWAAHDAELRGVPLTLVYVVAPIILAAEPWPEVTAPAEYTQWQEDEADQALARAREAALAASALSAEQVSTEILHGPIVSTLVDLSDSADLFVVGCRGQGAVSRALLGSVSSGLVHHAHCPVAVIHEETPPTAATAGAPVIVGIDGSACSEYATEIAFDEASRRGVDLVAMHAWSDMGPIDFASVNWAPIEWRNIKVAEEEVLAERLAGWRERYPDVTVHRHVVCDRPTPRLLERAQSAQLIVVGSHGRGGFEGMLLGSVGAAIVNSALIPVIVARTRSAKS